MSTQRHIEEEQFQKARKAKAEADLAELNLEYTRNKMREASSKTSLLS